MRLTSRLLLAVLILFSENSLAEVCQKLEFAELDSFAKDELLQVRCEYRRQGRVYLLNLSDIQTSVRCSDEQMRIDRILSKKLGLTPEGALFNIDTPEGKAQDLSMQIENMCKKMDHSE